MNSSLRESDRSSTPALTTEQRGELLGISARLTHWSPEFILTMLEDLVARGEIELLRQFKDGALLRAQVPWRARADSTVAPGGKVDNKGDWSGLPLTVAAWLQAPDPTLRAFAVDWLQTFGGERVDLPMLAQRELMREIAPDRGRVPFEDLRSGMRTKDGTTFDLVRAQRLAELAVPADETPALALEQVIERLIAPDRPKSSEKALANDAAVLAHIVHLDAQAHPEEPTQILTCGGDLNLMRCALRNDKPRCLIAIAGVFGETSDAFRSAVAQVLREINEDTNFCLDPSQAFTLPIRRGWLDADGANMVLTSAHVKWEKLPDDAEEQMVRRSYGRHLAESWELLPQAFELVRQLKAAGGNLDILSTAGEARQPALEWTATLLHHAVAQGTPELVQFLLVEMNCDPYVRCTIRDLNTGEVRERDCFELIRESRLGGKRFDLPAWKERSETVDEMLRAWRAHSHANKALVELLAASVGTNAP